MYSNHNLNSDDCCFDWNEEKAAELQRTGVSFDRSLTPQSLRTSTRRLSEENKQQSGNMHIDTSPSVVSDIISSRRDRSQDFWASFFIPYCPFRTTTSGSEITVGVHEIN